MSEPQAAATLVLACYNHARFVRDALASVAAQELVGIRLVVTDDASTDATVAALEAGLHEFRLSAQRIYHQQNAGLCATFNEALELVETPYVAFLSGDDWMSANRLARQVAELERNSDAAACYSDMTMMAEDGTTHLGSYSTETWPDDRPERPFASLLEWNWIPAPSVLLRTEVVRQIGGYDATLAFEDYDLWLRLSRTHRLVGIDDALVYCRKSSGSLTESLNTSRAQALHETMARTFVKHLSDDPTRGRVADRLFESALAAHRGEPWQSEYVRFMMACARTKPSTTRWIRTLMAVMRMTTAKAAKQRLPE